MATDYVVVIDRDAMMYDCAGCSGPLPQPLPEQDLAVIVADLFGVTSDTIRIDVASKRIEVV